MRHHFGDSLDREGDYWTTIPNRERYAYRIGDVPVGSREVTIVTIGKEDKNWSRALTLPNLEELTLHEPTTEQLLAVGGLRSIKRLRITHARPRTIEFIRPMAGIEELVLEYVSGFSDLTPLRSLTRLRALHIENLRRVSDFGGLSGVKNLRYLAVHGTTDWQQPIQDFEFLRGLPRLEVFALWQMICRAPYPALLPALSLRKLKKLRIHGSYLAAEEYALLEEGLKGVEGAAWGPYRTYAYRQIELPSDDLRVHLPEEVIRSKYPEVIVNFEGKRTIDDPASRWFEFTYRNAGRVKSDSTTAEARCREFSERYSTMKQRARALIDHIDHRSVPPLAASTIVPNDSKIQDIALTYVRKAIGDGTERPFSCFGGLHPSLSDQLFLADGELMIVSAFFSSESWYAFTTRRIVSKFQGVLYSLDPSHGIEVDFPNFKGYDPSDDSEEPRPGVITRDVATIAAKDSGAVVRFEYLTWEGFVLPMYAAMYWDRKHPFLDKLMTTAEREHYQQAERRLGSEP